MAPSRLQVVDNAEEAETPKQSNSVAIAMLNIALKTMSQRALIAVASLFNLAAGASVFVLAMSMPAPSVYQLVLLGMYAIFILCLCWAINRKP